MTPGVEQHDYLGLKSCGRVSPGAAARPKEPEGVRGGIGGAGGNVRCSICVQVGYGARSLRSDRHLGMHVRLQSPKNEWVELGVVLSPSPLPPPLPPSGSLPDSFDK